MKKLAIKYVTMVISSIQAKNVKNVFRHVKYAVALMVQFAKNAKMDIS